MKLQFVMAFFVPLTRLAVVPVALFAVTRLLMTSICLFVRMVLALTLMCVELHLRLQDLLTALGGSPLVPCMVTNFPFTWVVRVGLNRNLCDLRLVTELNLSVGIGRVVLSVLSRTSRFPGLVNIGTKLWKTTFLPGNLGTECINDIRHLVLRCFIPLNVLTATLDRVTTPISSHRRVVMLLNCMVHPAVALLVVVGELMLLVVLPLLDTTDVLTGARLDLLVAGALVLRLGSGLLPLLILVLDMQVGWTHLWVTVPKLKCSPDFPELTMTLLHRLLILMIPLTIRLTATILALGRRP